MRVLVTGATGFLGCHTVAALAGAGHKVRILARSPETVGAALGPVGVGAEAVETFAGDVTDPTAVEDALAGCDGVVHAAAAVSMDPRRGRATFRGNVGGGELVRRTAQGLGLDPIVHISGVPTMLPCRDAVLTPDAPLGASRYGYLRSKVAVEELARRLQADAVPLVIFQPGLMLGPHDPKFGMGSRLVRDIFAGKMPLVPGAGLPLGDVRDAAAAVVRTVEPGRGPRRYLAGGTYTSFADFVDAIAEVAERPIPRRVVSPRLALTVARVADVLQHVVPPKLPITGAEAWAAAQDPHTDDSRARAELGFAPRDLRITLADTIRSLVAQGRLARATVRSDGSHPPKVRSRVSSHHPSDAGRFHDRHV
jgi:dihydroflavonol-4-reductase